MKELDRADRSTTENLRPGHEAIGSRSVRLTLEDARGTLALDYDEVCISRRLYRSGESEYYINGSKCRLKDILEMFRDTGIGKEGYSIIGQGRIDEYPLLSATGEAEADAVQAGIEVGLFDGGAQGAFGLGALGNLVKRVA